MLMVAYVSFQDDTWTVNELLVSFHLSTKVLLQFVILQ